VSFRSAAERFRSGRNGYDGDMNRLTLAASSAAVALAGLATWRAFARKRLSLEGCVVVITGGSRGLGLALAREFGRRGAKLAICGRDEAHLDRARSDLEGYGYEALTVPCDVRDARSVDRFIERVADRYGRIDIVVNNAGIISVGPLEEMSREDFDDAMRTHLWGAYHTIEASMPLLASARRPAIANIASIGGLVSVPHLLPYSASKFALVGYSLGLGAELAARGISVTTVCPGLMRTGSPRNALFKGRSAAEYAWFMLGDALPFSSISAPHAARRIVDAIERGVPFVILSSQARLLAAMQHLTPNLTLRLLALTAVLLPRAGSDAGASRRGYQSESAITQSPLCALNRRAEVALNQR
jgi:NAD(P)-dependent dehydrogenase (short-subunit alcohol dehydrogenase family)